MNASTLHETRKACGIFAAGTAVLGFVFLALATARPASSAPANPASATHLMTVAGLLLFLALTCTIAWNVVGRRLTGLHQQFTSHRKLVKQWRAVRKDLSITCRCGQLAKPMIGSNNRYRCRCGNQWADAPHHLETPRHYRDSDTAPSIRPAISIAPDASSTPS